MLNGIGFIVILVCVFGSFVISGGKMEIVLHAQDHALGFYERCGYEVEGDGFEEAGIPHHKMRKPL